MKCGCVAVRYATTRPCGGFGPNKSVCDMQMAPKPRILSATEEEKLRNLLSSFASYKECLEAGFHNVLVAKYKKLWGYP